MSGLKSDSWAAASPLQGEEGPSADEQCTARVGFKRGVGEVGRGGGDWGGYIIAVTTGISQAKEDA